MAGPNVRKAVEYFFAEIAQLPDGSYYVSLTATTIDEDGLRREVADLMRHFIADYDAVLESRKQALPYMLDAHRRVWQQDIGMDRFVARAC